MCYITDAKVCVKKKVKKKRCIDFLDIYSTAHVIGHCISVPVSCNANGVGNQLGRGDTVTY